MLECENIEEQLLREVILGNCVALLTFVFFRGDVGGGYIGKWNNLSN